MTEIQSNKQELQIRDAILMLLSDDEVASVSTSETALNLPEGSDYIDLEVLELGVQQAAKGKVVMGRVLPKAAVHAKTWTRILEALSGFAAPAAR